MKTIFVLVLGIAIGVGAWWYFSNNSNRPDFRLEARNTGEKIENAARSAGDKFQEKMRELVATLQAKAHIEEVTDEQPSEVA